MNKMKVHVLRLKSGKQVVENKKTVFQGKYINGKRKFVWGLPKSSQYGENTKLIEAWKNLSPSI